MHVVSRVGIQKKGFRGLQSLAQMETDKTWPNRPPLSRRRRWIWLQMNPLN